MGSPSPTSASRNGFTTPSLPEEWNNRRACCRANKGFRNLGNVWHRGWLVCFKNRRAAEEVDEAAIERITTTSSLME
jgi:hypothetical protein